MFPWAGRLRSFFGMRKLTFVLFPLFAATEGTIPAPETSHAIRAAINEAIRCREEGEEKCIVFNFSGHGLCDLGAYDKYFAGELQDYAYPREKIEAALSELPPVN